MNAVVEYDSSLKKGEEKLNNNEFFQDLCGLMENDQFKRFLDKHMNNWLDIKCSITYMHLNRKLIGTSIAWEQIPLNCHISLKKMK